MTKIAITALYPDTTPYANGQVTVKLVDGGSGGAVDGGTVVVAQTVRLDADGFYEIDLTPNADIDPPGTFYALTVVQSSPTVVRYIEVPAPNGTGPSEIPYAWDDETIQRLTVDPPDTIPSAASGTAGQVIGVTDTGNGKRYDLIDVAAGSGTVETVAGVAPVAGDIDGTDLRTVMATTPTIDVPSDETVTTIPDGPAQGIELILVGCSGGGRGFIKAGHPVRNPGRLFFVRADVVESELGDERKGPSFCWDEWTPATIGNFIDGGTVDPSPPVSYSVELVYDGITYPHEVPSDGLLGPGFFTAMADWAASVPDGAVEFYVAGDFSLMTLQTTDATDEHTLTANFPDGFIQDPAPIVAGATASTTVPVGPNRGVKGLGDFGAGGYEHLWPDSPKADANQQSGWLRSDGRTWLWTAHSKRSNDTIYSASNPGNFTPDIASFVNAALDDLAATRAQIAPGATNATAPTSLRLRSPDDAVWVLTIDNAGTPSWNPA